MSAQPPEDIAGVVTALTERLEHLERRADNERRRGGAHARDLARIGPQVAALEERVEQLRQRLSPPPTATDEEAERARSLLEAVRREHAQVKVRVTTLVKYEERIRQLEDEVARLRSAEPDPQPQS